MSQDKARSINIEEAIEIFHMVKEWVQRYEREKKISWDPTKNRTKRTEFVYSLMSLYNFVKDRYVFFNKKYLSNVIDLWKNIQYPGIRDELITWINIYENRLKNKKNLSEIGERFFDFSSSTLNLPFPFSQVLEYEAIPKWGEIMQDYRKLLGALSPIKIGIFHLPKISSTDKSWSQNEVTGEVIWKKERLDSNEPEFLLVEMENALLLNIYENPTTVYLIILIHSTYNKPVNVLGHIITRALDGEITRTNL